MKRQNPPQSSLDTADAIEKYLRPSSIAAMYVVLGISYIAIISLIFADLVANSAVSVSAVSVTFYVALTIIPASCLMLAWILRPEDLLSRYFSRLASRWRQPIVLPPDCCTFQALMMDGEPICIKLTFSYPEADQTIQTKERLYTYVQAALASDCCMRYKMPNRRQLEHVIDRPLDTLAEELKIPVLYCEVEDIYSMREGDIHTALALESSAIHLSRLEEFGYDYYPQPEEKMTSAYADIFRIRQSDVEETLATNYGKRDLTKTRADIELDEPREPIEKRDLPPVPRIDARIPRILEVERAPQPKPVVVVETAALEEVVVDAVPPFPVELTAEIDAKNDEPMETLLAAVQIEKNTTVETHEAVEPPVVAAKSEATAVDHEVLDQQIEAVSVNDTREEAVHAALTNVCMLLSDLPSLHDLDVVVAELPGNLADQTTAALYSKFKADPRAFAAGLEDVEEPESEDDFAAVNALRQLKKIGPGYTRSGDRSRDWLRTGT